MESLVHSFWDNLHIKVPGQASALLDHLAIAAVVARHARHHTVLLRLVQQHAAGGRRIQVLQGKSGREGG